jgi:superfamily II DNA or RNA helicase
MKCNYKKSQLIIMALQQGLIKSIFDGPKYSRSALCKLLGFDDTETDEYDPQLVNKFYSEDFDHSSCTQHDKASLEQLAEQLDIQVSGNKSEQCDELINFRDSHTREVMHINEKILKDHQKLVVEHMIHSRGLIAIHDVGTGKTYAALGTIEAILKYYPELKIGIISPASILAQTREKLLENKLPLHRIKLWTFQGFLNEYTANPEANYKGYFFIIDEAHNLTTHVNFTVDKITGKRVSENAQINYAVMKAVSQASKVLLLTATPIRNDPSEIINLIAMVDGVAPEDVVSSIVFNDYILKDPLKLKDYLHGKISRFKQSITPEFPEQLPDEFVYLEMSPDYYAKYKIVERQSFESATPDVVNALEAQNKNDAFYTKLRVTSVTIDDINSPKVQWILNFIIQETSQSHKVLVYTPFTSTGMEVLKRALVQKKIKFAEVSGQVTKDKEAQKDMFNSREAYVILISKAGAEGLDLKEVRHVVFMESNWNEALDQQIIGRAVRRNSHAALPPEDRNVKVWRVMMIKPKDVFDTVESIDQYMYKLAYHTKKIEVDRFLTVLENRSIELDPPNYLDQSAETSDKFQKKRRVITNKINFTKSEWSYEFLNSKLSSEDFKYTQTVDPTEEYLEINKILGL